MTTNHDPVSPPPRVPVPPRREPAPNLGGASIWNGEAWVPYAETLYQDAGERLEALADKHARTNFMPQEDRGLRFAAHLLRTNLAQVPQARVDTEPIEPPDQPEPIEGGGDGRH